MVANALDIEQYRPSSLTPVAPVPPVAVVAPVAPLGPAPSAPIVDLRRQRVEIGSVLIDSVDLAGAIRRLRAFLSSDAPHQIVTANLDFLSIADRNPAFRDAINDADLAVADGMPLVWVSRLRGQALPERINGVDLVDAGCKLAAETDHSVFLLGAAPEVTEAAARTLQARYPGLQIAGAYSPPFGPLDEDESERIVKLIQRAAPELLFVALGAPRQDPWIRENLDRLPVRVAIGVGCVFDLLAGKVSRAPVWMQRSGLEWAFRLAQEPGRLWRRYFVDDLPVLVRLLFAAPAGPDFGPAPRAEAPARVAP
jgi:N-acetylglucosaminyldiphosphoundecaprenol N-acetyl-beta-D-mannosaminyltransferase